MKIDRIEVDALFGRHDVKLDVMDNTLIIVALFAFEVAAYPTAAASA